ncbi:MAG: P1 family peptidase, partial [Acidobacteria bacterium]|nr:P1 family peptidase [Acidobacteriota bacterium]
VPAAILFDLGVGDPKIRPDRDSGYEACKAASSGTVAEGSVGAGAGATVGKMFGSAFAMKGGVGTSAIKLNSGLVVGALMTVNAMGDVVEPATGKLLAGARTPDGKRLINTVDALRRGLPGRSPLEGSNSTIGVVATNAQLTKPQITKVAQMAQDGLARAINPAHTPWDGDTIFALSTGTLTTPASVSAPDFVTTIGTLAAEAVAQAIVRAILRAAGLPGLPSHNDLFSAEPK